MTDSARTRCPRQGGCRGDAARGELDQTNRDINPALVSQSVVGDEGARIVHGIVLYADHAEAAAASSEAFFSDFKDVVEPLIEGAPTRFPLDLAHAWSK